MTLLALVKLALAEALGAEDIVVACPFASREEGLSDCVGLLVNMIVTRAQLGDDPSLADFLSRVRTSCIAAYDDRDLPFHQVLADYRETQPSGGPDAKLDQVVFILRDAEKKQLPDGFEVIELDEPEPKFDLKFDVTAESDGRLVVRLYGRAGPPAGVLPQLSHVFQQLCEHASAMINRRVSALVAHIHHGT